MYHSAGGGDDYTFQSVDLQLAEACRQFTDLSESDISILIETSHNLGTVHRLEGGDIFIDCLTRSGEEAVVVAQFSPLDTNYTRLIVGELMLPQNEPGVFRTLQLGVPSRKLKAVVTGNYLIRQNVSPIFGSSGDVIAVLIVERHMQREESWEGAEQGRQNFLNSVYETREIENIAECMNDGMIRFNKQGNAVYANPSAKQLYKGINYMDDIIGLPFANLSFGNIVFSQLEKGGRNSHREVKINSYILNVIYTPIYEGNDFTGAVMLIEDQTEEKIKEKELILKSAAIEEIHHRVKNNLQTIISLLRMQSRRLEDPLARQAFSEAMSRIFSISLTHEILAQKGVGDVELMDMLSRMLNSAKGYFIPEGLKLSMNISGDKIVLNSDITTSIAMVVNELVQNSIKHAFLERQEGRIQLNIKKGKSYSTIEVADDGQGYKTADIRPGSLGHKLVRSLVEDKLKGEIKIISSAKGTNVIFTFSHKPDKVYSKSKAKALEELRKEYWPEEAALQSDL